MKIFLSHQSQNKSLVREFKSLLPSFLETWFDEENLPWGGIFPDELKSSIQSGVDFLIIFLDKDTLNSQWVKQELEWAIEREKEMKRKFVLPILLGEVGTENLPAKFLERSYLHTVDTDRLSIAALANKATIKLFQLVVEDFSGRQIEIPHRESLSIIRDQLSAGQAKLLGYIVQQCKGAREVPQRQIEETMGHHHTSPHLFYRLESLIAQGFLLKRRLSDGQFSYRLSDDFEKEVC